ncbi:MAG: putative Ig domain-containing protein [Candidatus Eisenbacteria bacterium]|nr:putative Ig domain-containing protein [Candidatus Eisenbacteria bacterium]
MNKLNGAIAPAFPLFLCLLFLCCSGQGQKTRNEEGASPTTVLETGRIYPGQAYANNHLEVRFRTNPRTKLPDVIYTWKRNGVIVPGVTGNSLEPENVHKGDQISVEVALLDSTFPRKVFRLPAVTILNTPPQILEASLALEGRQLPSISVMPRCLDVDNDQIAYSYRWFKNGRKMNGQASATLNPSVVQREDEIYAEIIASDGETSSPPFRTGPLKLENHAPSITSSPPTSTSGALLIYQVVCEDADGDHITYELLSGPPHMSINDKGKIEWTVPSGEERKPTYDVRIGATDGHGGEAIQSFTFSIPIPEPKQ